MNRDTLLARARDKGVNPFVYWFVRAVLQPFFHIYFRLSRVGREHVPESGPVIFAANHRSFLDPFVIGTLMRRPVYYVAKKELFENRFVGWVLSSLGAFPVDRGAGDADSMATARAILERGDCVVVFPEGTRTRPGSLGSARRGVGRLALETGAPVLPVAVIGTEAIRRGWRIRPHKVRIRCGSPLTFPRVATPSPQLAGAVTERIWPCVMLQWEWLGGTPPLRRAAVIGADAAGATVAAMLARAGLEVDLGCRTPQQASAIAAGDELAGALGLALPEGVRPVHAAALELSGHDLVVFAVSARALPAAVAAHGGRIPERAGVLVLSRGLVPPLGTLPTAYVAERVRARAVARIAGPAQDATTLDRGGSIVLACHDKGFGRQLGETLSTAGFDVRCSDDVIGVELAGAAKDAAGLAAAIAAAAGPAIAGAAAGKVFGEIDAYARSHNGAAESFSGLAGAGDLVATVLSAAGPAGRPAELLGRRAPDEEMRPALGPAVEAIDSVPLLAGLLRDAGVSAPTLTGLSEIIEGRLATDAWTEAVTAPVPAGAREVRAA